MTALGATERKRIRGEGERASRVASVLADMQGLAVAAEGERADLLLVEASTPEELQPFASERARVVTLAWRRLRESEVKALRDAGASAVVDADASVLDLAFVCSDLLFGAVAALRRYGRRTGGVPVQFRAAGGEDIAEGTLLGIARSGAFMVTEARIEEGTAVELQLLGPTLPVTLRGRVAYADEPHAREGLAIEFALDDGDVAPKVSALEALAEAEPRATSNRTPDLTSPRHAPSLGSTRI